MIKRKYFLGILMLDLSACSTVTVTPSGQNKLVNKPTYEESKHFYLWGTVGEHHVDVLFFVILSGCSTIHFDKGEHTQTNRKIELWHHNFALALYEGSPVVNLKNECGNAPWASVKTEQSFINSLAEGAVNMLGPIWYPKTVEISCN